MELFTPAANVLSEKKQLFFCSCQIFQRQKGLPFLIAFFQFILLFKSVQNNTVNYPKEIPKIFYGNNNFNNVELLHLHPALLRHHPAFMSAWHFLIQRDSLKIYSLGKFYTHIHIALWKKKCWQMFFVASLIRLDLSFFWVGKDLEISNSISQLECLTFCWTAHQKDCVIVWFQADVINVEPALDLPSINRK